MEQIDILRHTVDALERLEVPYLIVGSFASIAYGESRFTQHIDVMVAAPEDVIIGKLWYYAAGGGDRHLRDIAGILRVTGAGVDRAEVERWARQLGYLEIWQQIVQKVDAPDPPAAPPAPSGPAIGDP